MRFTGETPEDPIATNDSSASRRHQPRARTHRMEFRGIHLSRDQAVQYLVEILKTPIGEVTVDHRLAQSYDAKSGKIELPNKLGAMQQLAKLCGWNEPEKFEHGASDELTELLIKLRGGSPG